MTSVISNDLRTFLLDNLRSDVENGGSTNGNYYVGISRAKDFVASDNIASRAEQFDLRNALQAVKVLSNTSFVVPAVEWENNAIYSAYDDRDPNQSNFYVTNSNNEVFVCISSPGTAATVEPTATAAGFNTQTFATADNYLWRYLYRMTNLAFSNFRSNTYMPVKKVTGSPRITEEIEQLQLQDSATDGELLGFSIDSAGSNYSVAPDIIITGNADSEASFAASISSGQISSIDIQTDSEGIYQHGSGYDYAAASLSIGDGKITPVFAPKGGLNADPVLSLKSKSLMLQVDIQGDEAGTIFAENDFRQIALIRNPKKYNSDSDFTANTGSAMKSLVLNPTSVSGTFEKDTLIETSTGLAKACVFFHDRTIETIYYYQTSETGFEAFTNGLDISNEDNETATISSQGSPEVDAYSGDILYLNNVAVIERASNQTEDIRIVIELG